MHRAFAFALCSLAAVQAQQVSLTELSRLEMYGAKAAVSSQHGTPGLRLTPAEDRPMDAFATIKGLSFRNGTIDVDVSGSLLETAPGTARGFIGMLFRVQPGGSRYECFYIRPTNGRADDQLRRNHSVQYVSAPDWPWERLRKETPGVYESYADMVPGKWIHLRAVVNGTNALLYVGEAAQPTLIVHDLKLGDVPGSVGLWIGPGTDGYFRDLVVSTETP